MAASSLAAHFPTKRRIFAAPDAAADPRVLQRASSERERVAFRFDFDLRGEKGGPTEDATTTKNKNKKKKKKKSKKKTPAEDGNGDGVGGESLSTVANPPLQKPEPVATSDKAPDATTEASTKPTNKKKKKKSKTTTATTTQPPPHDAHSARAAAPPVDASPSPAPALPAPAPLAPAPGFFKLRKPTSSDSEVTKMQLRYGRGRRNAAALAQRAKQRQTSPPLPPPDDTSFQFNFF